MKFKYILKMTATSLIMGLLLTIAFLLLGSFVLLESPLVTFEGKWIDVRGIFVALTGFSFLISPLIIQCSD